MAATLAERSAVPFHLGLTEPIDEATITGYPAVEGGYDPVAQIWRLPAGTPLSDPQAIIEAPYETETFTFTGDKLYVDDIHPDY
jgi:hypothetical protein